MTLKIASRATSHLTRSCSVKQNNKNTFMERKVKRQSNDITISFYNYWNSNFFNETRSNTLKHPLICGTYLMTGSDIY